MKRLLLPMAANRTNLKVFVSASLRIGGDIRTTTSSAECNPMSRNEPKRSEAVMKRSMITAIVLGMLVVLAASASVSFAQDVTTRPEGWNDYSHSNDTDPVYDIVFPQNQVNTVTITISPENWQVML